MFALTGKVFAVLDLILVAIVALHVLPLLFRRRIPKGLRLPPGPPRQPLVGNILHMPTDQEWVTLAQWAKEYGDIVYLSGLGKSIVVVNSQDVAHELFEKRSSIYSDRSHLPMIEDLMGWGWLTTFLHYGEGWRKHRRVMQEKLNSRAVAEYQHIQLKHTRTLLKLLYETPDDFAEHLRHISGAIIMEIVYGIKVLPKDDPYIVTAEKAIDGLVFAGLPGAFLVDNLPILKYVPEWVPGAGFQKKARLWRKLATEMNTAPFEAVKKAITSGTVERSFTSSLLEDLSLKGNTSPEQEEVIRGAGSTLYTGGSDTARWITVNVLHIFFLAMVLFPEAQRKAQEELDEVVGFNRLPEYEDKENLPYTNALCKEVLRWHPIIPLGVPHRVTQDDDINGYFIPAGSIVIGNTWTLLRDEATYGANTDKFYPERFLTPGVKDPKPAFGYSRRICPGQYFADNSVFIAIASTLSVFDITPSRDGSGKVIPVEATFHSGLISRPMPFKCAISPRSETAKRLILLGGAN